MSLPAPARPRLILHVGMGKTGSSALQRALKTATDELAAQGVRYAGVDLSLKGASRIVANMREVLSGPPEKLAQDGDAYGRMLVQTAAAGGPATTIVSNESLYELSQPLQPFMTGLQRHVDVRMIAWARNPQDWLPAAYLQWGVRHKTIEGPVRPYPQDGRRIIGRYIHLAKLARLAGDLLEVRPYVPGIDVVKDFSEATGIALTAPTGRFYERPAPAESVLRAIFNDRIPKAVMPNRFDRAVHLANAGRSMRPLAERAASLFDYAETDAIIAENAAMFDEVREATGLDPRALPSRPVPAMPDVDALRGDLVDMLTAIVLDQARRIAALEAIVADLPGAAAAAAAVEDDDRPRQRPRRNPRRFS